MDDWQTLLVHLFKEGKSWTSKLNHNDWRKKIVTSRGILDDLRLQIVQEEPEAVSWVREKAKHNSSKGFVLAPGKHGPDSLVLLAPLFSGDNEELKLSLQIGFLLEKKGVISFFGYRFESPEGYDEHNFYHVQPIQSLGRGDPIAHAVSWYPDCYPTFPLKARNTFELVAAMILACRDWRHMMDLATSPSLGRAVKQPLTDFLDHVKSVAG